jgi:anti-anti-sigma factor
VPLTAGASPPVAEVTSAGGVVTARIRVDSLEEQPAAVILKQTRDAMAALGGGLRGVVLDLGGVSFINSSGLAACIEVRNFAAEHGARTVVYRPQEQVSLLFRMMRVDRLYTFAHSDEELRRAVT